MYQVSKSRHGLARTLSKRLMLEASRGQLATVFHGWAKAAWAGRVTRARRAARESGRVAVLETRAALVFQVCVFQWSACGRG